MKNKGKLISALQLFVASEKDLIIEISSALVKIETDLSGIDLEHDKSSLKYYALQKRKEFALKMLAFFESSRSTVEAQQEYIRYLENIELEHNNLIQANTLMTKVASVSVAKHLIANGMSDADVNYCMNLKRA